MEKEKASVWVVWEKRAEMSSGGGTTDVAAAASGGGGTGGGGGGGSGKAEPLHLTYPVNTYMELTLKGPSGERVQGVVYCTDEISNSIVLRKALPHTTLTSEVRIVNASSIAGRRTIEAATKKTEDDGAGADAGPSPADVDEMTRPLPPVSRRTLEEREKRALRLAEEHLLHVNQSATPEGQITFDRLLKACNEVVWKGRSIVVLHQVRVDPPYGPDDCRLVSPGKTEKERGLNVGSLERVKKIVAHVEG